MVVVGFGDQKMSVGTATQQRTKPKPFRSSGGSGSGGSSVSQPTKKTVTFGKLNEIFIDGQGFSVRPEDQKQFLSSQGVSLTSEITSQIASQKEQQKISIAQQEATKKAAEQQLEENRSRTVVGQLENQISERGEFPDEFEPKPTLNRLKESASNTVAFLRGEASFLDIIRPFEPEIKESPRVEPQPLFIPGGSGTVIPDFEGFGAVDPGLSPREFREKRQSQAGELPEFIDLLDPRTGKGTEVRIGGTRGVPREAVEQNILAQGVKNLQKDIDAGIITIPGETDDDFQKAARKELQKRTGPQLARFDQIRNDFEGFGTVPLATGLEIGTIAALSTNPFGATIVGASLTARGQKSASQGILGEDLTLGQRILLLGTGALDVGFGFAIGGSGVSQAPGSMLSKRAIRDVQKDLAKQKFDFQGEVVLKKGDDALIKGTSTRSFGGDTQTIDLILPTFRTGKDTVAVTGGRGISTSKIFDPISGKFITSTEKISLGSLGNLDITRGGKVRN